MNPSLFAVPLLAATCLVLGLLALSVRNRRGSRKRGFLEISPRYRSFFRGQGLTEADHFLDLLGQTPHIVSGHPDRHVVRIALGSGPQRWIAFLKREHRVRWQTRLSNALAGAGFLSRSLREARMLQALERENIPGPEWLAVGENGQGRAFLLVREAPGVELRSLLRTELDPARRRRLAHNLGGVLARVHSAGFRHPDLYAHHLFVDPQDDSIHLLDWQRARLRRLLTWKERRRDLAALHATTGDVLATPRERLRCLRAYWQTGAPCGPAWKTAVRQIEKQARRLLTHRHIHEKRSLPAQPQAWICLEDEALYVTPLMRQRCGGRIPDYLQADAPANADAAPIRRWPISAEGKRMLLVRRREPMGRRSSVSLEQRQAALLLRLQRHGIPAPQVLAMGQRRDERGRVESLLLTEPLSDTGSLEAWLACQTRRRETPAGQWRRGDVLHQCGALLRRLHEASCYLDVGPLGCGFAVRQADGLTTVVLDRVECLRPARRQKPRWATRDVRRLRQRMQAAGCGSADLTRFQDGYHGANGRRQPVGEANGQRQPAGSVANQPADAGRSPRQFPLLRGIRRLCQRPDWAAFAGDDWPERVMDVSVTDRFNAKQGRSTGRWILHAPASAGGTARRLAVYLKRHYVLPWWQGLLALAWPGRGWSPAFQEWRHLEWARRQGLPVPRAVAAAEYIGPWGRLRSFLAVEELAGMLSLQEAIPLAAVRQDAASFRQWKRGLTAELARLARMMHDRRCFHKDLYLCHFFIDRDDTRAAPAQGWRGRVHLIDLHRFGHHAWTRPFWQTKDLAQLLYSSEIIGVDARDRLYFWRAYRGGGPCRPKSVWMRRLILYRWRRYRRHNARNRGEES